MTKIKKRVWTKDTALNYIRNCGIGIMYKNIYCLNRQNGLKVLGACDYLKNNHFYRLLKAI